jgi:TonB family protein
LPSLSHRFLFLCALLLLALPVWAQDDAQLEQPVYLTARLFEVRVPRGRDPLTNQVFRLRTAALTDDEKWLSNLKKAYPDATDAALLRTGQFRLFRRPRPGLLIVGDAKLPHLEVHFLVAQGLRDDDTINTTALSEVNFYAGAKSQNPIPLSMASHGFEIEPGLTYFYTADGIKLKPETYTTYFREGNVAASDGSFDPYLVLALSSEETKHVPFTFDETKSATLQTKASRKAEPQWPEVVPKRSLFGKVQVRVELNAAGKVTTASIWASTLPEGNLAALEAARQWEFPSAELAGINAPASALLTFAIAPPKAPEKKSEAKKPATTKPTAKKPPVKRPTK